MLWRHARTATLAALPRARPWSPAHPIFPPCFSQPCGESGTSTNSPTPVSLARHIARGSPSTIGDPLFNVQLGERMSAKTRKSAVVYRRALLAMAGIAALYLAVEFIVMNPL
ncbi:hypothetical protein F1599_14500 [Cupriavidus cauae]|uniref:Uncharacterized protein n=1 Tax=Cupriavidus cauae TaxID=2608999 RepID=A0A5M8AI89_9BURK|nr:hypothetical protein F1599_14500 [Cupriavidus cauae]